MDVKETPTVARYYNAAMKRSIDKYRQNNKDRTRLLNNQHRRAYYERKKIARRRERNSAPTIIAKRWNAIQS